MTIYVLRSDLETRFGETELAQTAWRESMESDLVIQQACLGASQMIDAHLASRYRLPLDPLPEMVKEIALDIAWWKLWRGPIPEEVQTRYREAMRLLERISAGTIDLQAEGVSPPEAESGITVAIESDDRRFTDESMGGY